MLSVGHLVGRSHPDPDRAARLWHAALFEPTGDFASEVADHRRWREPMNGLFSQRNVERFRPRARRILTNLIDRMMAEGSPADLCSALTRPFAARCMLEFVGIPAEAHHLFVARSRALRTGKDPVRAAALQAEIDRCVRDLLRYRRRRPAGDVVTAVAAGGSWRTEAERIEAAGNSSITEYETIAARIEYGMLFLLAHADQLADLRDDPSLVSGTVEEVLRVAVPGGSWIARYARTDLDRGKAEIRTGDLVVFAIQSVNLDPDGFTDPHRFDIRRRPNRHLAFGVGKFYCLGAALSRVLLAEVLSALPARLPSLRPAVPLDTVTTDDDKVTGGLARLPVAWSAAATPTARPRP